jgi:hypothetical protein
MKGTKVNRRLVLIAFLLAVIGGAGGQAVALWSQSSDVTMQVTYGKTAPVTVSGCQSKGNSGQVTITWANPADVAMTSFTVSVYRPDGSSVTHSVQGTSFTVDAAANRVQAGDVLSITIVGQYGAYQSATATYDGIRGTAKPSGQVTLSCP